MRTSATLPRLASAVRDRRVSCLRLITTSLERIEALDASLHAVVDLRAEDALREATELDRLISESGAPNLPLLGLPCLIKDMDDVQGLPTRQGSLTRADADPAESDAYAPARLKSAGAIVIGKSSTPEFAAEGHTASLLHPPTGNPWAPHLSPGGSSGGSACALAAGMVPLASGSDGGGSVRIPASFCGLVGFKPTRGVIARRPIPAWPDLTSDGVLATSVADARLVLEVLAGQTPGDPDSAGAVHQSPRPADLPWVPPARILALADRCDGGSFATSVEENFRHSVSMAEHAWGRGVEWISHLELFKGANPDESWYVIASADQVAYLGRSWIYKHLGALHPSTADFLRFGLDVDIDAYLAARRHRFEIAAAVDEHLTGVTILLSPVTGVSAIPADGQLPDGGYGARPMHDYTTAWQNLTGHPAICLPAGLTEQGIPYGIQVTGPRFSDQFILDLGERFQDLHAWPVCAPGYRPFTVEEICP